MNKQKTNKGRGIEWCDYTINPIAGCKHGCKWTMPDGSVANCYADDVATKVAQSAYPQGFEHHYWKPDQLTAPQNVKTPSKIFVGSMADVFGHWVPTEQVQAVLDMCAAAPWHTFQFLTKNAPRLLQFKFPPNVWVGVSAPPSHFMSKPLKHEQQIKYVHRALDVLINVKAPVRWMSIEPLSFDIAAVMQGWRDKKNAEFACDVELPLEWAVIGAASNGRKIYQPEPAWVESLLAELSVHRDIPVFYKGNLKNNPAAQVWREGFPE